MKIEIKNNMSEEEMQPILIKDKERNAHIDKLWAFLTILMMAFTTYYIILGCSHDMGISIAKYLTEQNIFQLILINISLLPPVMIVSYMLINVITPGDDVTRKTINYNAEKRLFERICEEKDNITKITPEGIYYNNKDTGDLDIIPINRNLNLNIVKYATKNVNITFFNDKIECILPNE